MKIIKENKINIKETIAALKNGAVLVCPTDTVYGLICDAANEKAVEKIFLIKKRDKAKPLLVFVSSTAEAKKIATINDEQEKFLEKNWPGVVTVILQVLPVQARNSGLSPLVYKNNTIGIREPNYEFLNNILEKFENPLAQTSANISGEPATTEIKEVLRQFEGQEVQPDIIIDAGDLPNNKPSAIIDLTNNKIKILR